MPQQPPRIPESQVTPEDAYSDRRGFLKRAGVFAVGAAVVGGGLYALTDRRANHSPRGGGGLDPDASGKPPGAVPGGGTVPTSPDSSSENYDTDEPQTSFDDVTTYNNFYEFGTSKSAPAALAHTLKPRPWKVEIAGHVAKPATYDIDTLLGWFPTEERIYRMRCVEAWSMVIPWLGFPLHKLIDRVEPTSKARYVAFETLLDKQQFPGQRGGALDWPYVEGLRLDEARHPLTMIATGLYGKSLLGQNGAPLRLVVPWKYGFKGIKSIVRITFTENEPPTSWNRAASDEYGFYANVNPNVDHPRWSQASERRIGEFLRRDTLPFNGYGEQVAALYRGMDLRRHF